MVKIDRTPVPPASLAIEDEDSLNIVLGDALNETMPNALYSTYIGDVQSLQAVIINL